MDDFHNIYLLFGVAVFVFSVLFLLLWEIIRSQLRFQAICENSGSMVVIGKAVAGKNGVIADIEIVGCNEVYARHLDKKVDEIIGLRLARDFYDGVEPDWLDVVRDVIATHESRHLEFSYEPRGTRYTGSVFCLSFVRKRCCFIMEETSADFKRRSELSRVRKLMDTILEMSRVGMWQWDLKSDTLNVIKATFKFVAGHDRQKVSIDNVMNQIHPDDRGALLSLKSNLPVDDKPAEPVEFRMLDRTGNWRWFQAVAVKTEYDGNGVPEMLVGVAFDIDSLKRSQLKVQEISKEFEINQKWLMYSLQQSRTGYCRWDIETDKFHYSDNFWQAVAGLSVEEETALEIPDRMSEFREFMVAEDQEGFNRWVDKVMRGEPLEYEFRCHLSFLPERFFEVRVNVLEKDEFGKATVISGFIIDITDIQKKEEALRNAIKEADEANKAKGRFLAIMSHEIRTPLNAIIGFSSILKSADISDQLQSYADSIKNSGEMLLDLINDLLDLAKIESAKMQLKLEPVNLLNLLSELKGMFALKVKVRNLYFDLNCAQNLPLFNLDVKRTQQVLVNLIGNAVKFTDKGGITLDVNAAEQKSSGGGSEGSGIYRLLISVRDTGRGIPEKDYDTIFNPFEQAANNHDNYVEGTGLGLAICKNLVELMGGTLTFESEVGKGSSFVVELDEVESVPEMSDPGLIEDALNASESEQVDISAINEIPSKVFSEVADCFGERFIEMKNGMHVKSARVLVDDLETWMKSNNSYEIKDMVDSLRQAVEDFNVTEVKRIARFFVEQRNENE